VDIRPLDVMLVNQEVAPHVAVPAYDLLSAADRQRILKEDLLNFVNAIRLPDDYPPDDSRDPDRHLHDSLAALRLMVRDGVFRPVPGPAFFVYQLTAGTHRQIAIVADVPMSACANGQALRHEDTRIDKQSGLVQYMDTVRASSSPVCLAYRPVAAIDALVAEVTAADPDLDFVASSGTRQEVWQITDMVVIGQLTSLFREVPRTYITDGHHRVAATAASTTADSFMAALFPINQLRLVAFHRCVRDLGSETPASMLQRINERFDIATLEAESEAPTPACGVISMRLGGRWHQISLKTQLRPEQPWEDLDVITLQTEILDPILGITEPRSDSRLVCVTSRITPQAITGWIDAGVYAAAFLLHPMSLDQLMAISDAGRTLPPKSTWFTPKAGSGIFLRFDDH
jgi:uncharacterized protein (DUF1015 family)